MTYLYVPPVGPRKSETCPWCREIPVNSGHGAVLAGCTCYVTGTGAPSPCERGRCPASLDEGPPDQVRMIPGSYRIVSNA